MRALSSLSLDKAVLKETYLEKLINNVILFIWLKGFK